jgi:lipopolysaccharide/colanic/teichoic acid biosynthesis glycosyltransferase
LCAGKQVHPGLCEVLKRVVDAAGAAVLLVVCAPLMLAVAAAVKLSTPGPALFRQVRVGLNGRRFHMWKFRTMVDGAAGMQAQLAHKNEAGKILFKIRNDPRITDLGRILRRLSLDELPQLWNVLKGEMSLVGPRPPVPGEVMKYSPTMLYRLRVKPGMTGLWQVTGRSTIPHLRGFALDTWYARKWCLLLDFAILMRTFSAVISRKGAL